MIGAFKGWRTVSAKLVAIAKEQEALELKSVLAWLNEGQRATIRAIADRIEKHGVIIADEVGMGKTRIAVALAGAVTQAGGRVAILVPPGLGYQWEDELRQGTFRELPPLVRSMNGFLSAWSDPEQLKPWFASSVVLVSQNFANWRLSRNSDYWRRALLPAVYVDWLKRKTGRYPRYTSDHEALTERERRAAQSIVDAVPSGANPATTFLDRLQKEFDWGGTLEGDYDKGTPLRKLLERAVGLGLGVFDLVIVDEAHKARGVESGLSTLLENLLFTQPEAKRICMTATPVELDVSQWDGPLQRIGLDDRERGRLKEVILGYAASVRKVRRSWRGSERDRVAFKDASRRYQRELGRYVLRRDKRQDEHVQKFAKHLGSRWLSIAWKKKS